MHRHEAAVECVYLCFPSSLMRANSSANDTTSVSVTESSCVHSKDGLSTARTSYEKDLEQLAVEKAAPVAFSEGGRQGWLNVLGG